jgi:hypothetical protein
MFVEQPQAKHVLLLLLLLLSSTVTVSVCTHRDCFYLLL